MFDPKLINQASDQFEQATSHNTSKRVELDSRQFFNDWSGTQLIGHLINTALTKLCTVAGMVFIFAVLVGCALGNGRICGPQTPAAYCDEEAYLKLMYPKPYLQYWMKDGVSPEARRYDSENCGAMATNLQDEPDRYPIFSQNDYQAMERPGEEKFITEKRLIAEWQRCMLAKGYSVSEEWMLLIDKF